MFVDRKRRRYFSDRPDGVERFRAAQFDELGEVLRSPVEIGSGFDAADFVGIFFELTRRMRDIVARALAEYSTTRARSSVASIVTATVIVCRRFCEHNHATEMRNRRTIHSRHGPIVPDWSISGVSDTALDMSIVEQILRSPKVFARNAA